MGLSLALPLAACLYGMTPLAQRLKVVAVVGAGWQGHDVVDEDGCGEAASCSTVAVQRLLGEDRVADVAPALVVAALVRGRTVVRLAGATLRAAD
ncbi:MAG: hypothetical protein OXJ55_09130 [Caldilineaceae bacterium]|nr:hypothetical protein [Caldilineaceae bacterium]